MRVVYLESFCGNDEVVFKNRVHGLANLYKQGSRRDEVGI